MEIIIKGFTKEQALEVAKYLYNQVDQDWELWLEEHTDMAGAYVRTIEEKEDRVELIVRTSLKSE